MKLIIIAVALPLVSLGAGYGAGLALGPATSEAAQEAVAEDAAHGEAGHAAEPSHGESAGHGKEAAHDAAAAVPMDPGKLDEDRTIIRLGQMTIPVEKANSVSYVVADFALKMETFALAERYKQVEEATRIRDSLLTAMNTAAESSVLRGVAIDSDALSNMIHDLLSRNYSGIDEVMFVSLYKQDVARM